jgi:uncharacterized membrane protein (DUF106 family)
VKKRLEARDDTLREMKETKRIMQEFRDEVAAAKEKKKAVVEVLVIKYISK